MVKVIMTSQYATMGPFLGLEPEKSVNSCEGSSLRRHTGWWLGQDPDGGLANDDSY